MSSSDNFFSSTSVKFSCILYAFAQQIYNCKFNA